MPSSCTRHPTSPKNYALTNRGARLRPFLHCLYKYEATLTNHGSRKIQHTHSFINTALGTMSIIIFSSVGLPPVTKKHGTLVVLREDDITYLLEIYFNGHYRPRNKVSH